VLAAASSGTAATQSNSGLCCVVQYNQALLFILRSFHNFSLKIKLVDLISFLLTKIENRMEAPEQQLGRTRGSIEASL
jgi:hypothetical protein